MFFYYFVNSGTFSHIIKKKKNNIKIEKIDQESRDIPELMWPNANRTLICPKHYEMKQFFLQLQN